MRLKLLLVSLVAVLLGAFPSTTTAAATFTFDVPANVPAGAFNAVADADAPQAADAWESTASASGEVRGTNCVVATDATLAGRPASALPSGPQPISVLQDVFGGTFKPVSGRAEITALMTDAGSGARGVVFGSRGSDVGHVFNAVNQGGTVRFLDGQTGAAASFSGFDGFQFMLIPGR